MLKLIEKLAQKRKENPDLYEATRFVQERVDLYFEENSSNIRRSDSEHNATGRGLSGHLITYATIVIGLVTLVFSQENLLNSLNGYQKGFLLAGLVALFLSLLAGALEQWDAMQQYKLIASLYSKANKEAPLNKVESLEELHEFRNDLFKNISSTSRSRGLISQIFFLTLGSILYLILFTTVLF